MEFNIEKLFEKAFKDAVERKTNTLKKLTKLKGVMYKLCVKLDLIQVC
jgi:hypothetical protein